MHGDLEEEVYIEIPFGFTTNFRINSVCKLKKALYELKQSPRAWFGRFTTTIKKKSSNNSMVTIKSSLRDQELVKSLF